VSDTGNPAETISDKAVPTLGDRRSDLLDVARLGRDTVELRKESLTLQAIVTEALETTLGFADARRHRVSVSLPAGPLSLEADATRLTQAVTYLLDNAVKFTPPGGEISMIEYREGNEIVLRVRDTGVGISPEMLPLVVDLCAQADRSLPHAEEGLGVGLTLARILGVDAHSEGAGHGSEFVLRLPIGAPVGRQGGPDPT
jgi:signal transduction histidine kinase